MPSERLSVYVTHLSLHADQIADVGMQSPAPRKNGMTPAGSPMPPSSPSSRKSSAASDSPVRARVASPHSATSRRISALLLSPTKPGTPSPTASAPESEEEDDANDAADDDLESSSGEDDNFDGDDEQFEDQEIPIKGDEDVEQDSERAKQLHDAVNTPLPSSPAPAQAATPQPQPTPRPGLSRRLSLREKVLIRSAIKNVSPPAVEKTEQEAISPATEVAVEVEPEVTADEEQHEQPLVEYYEAEEEAAVVEEEQEEEEEPSLSTPTKSNNVLTKEATPTAVTPHHQKQQSRLAAALSVPLPQTPAGQSPYDAMPTSNKRSAQRRAGGGITVIRRSMEKRASLDNIKDNDAPAAESATPVRAQFVPLPETPAGSSDWREVEDAEPVAEEQEDDVPVAELPTKTRSPVMQHRTMATPKSALRRTRPMPQTTTGKSLKRAHGSSSPPRTPSAQQSTMPVQPFTTASKRRVLFNEDVHVREIAQRGQDSPEALSKEDDNKLAAIFADEQQQEQQDATPAKARFASPRRTPGDAAGTPFNTPGGSARKAGRVPTKNPPASVQRLLDEALRNASPRRTPGRTPSTPQLSLSTSTTPAREVAAAEPPTSPTPSTNVSAAATPKSTGRVFVSSEMATPKSARPTPSATDLSQSARAQRQVDVRRLIAPNSIATDKNVQMQKLVATPTGVPAGGAPQTARPASRVADLRNQVDELRRRQSLPRNAQLNTDEQFAEPVAQEEPATVEATPAKAQPVQTIRIEPKTPHMGDLKHVLAEPKEIATPFSGDLRHVFSERAAEQQTPRMGELRHLLREPKEHTSRTPAYGDIKHMMSNAVPPSTPSFVGLKDMAALPKVAATPSFVGLREMTAEQAYAPKTPTFNGMREMFHTTKESAPTPDMRGVRDMMHEVRAPAPTPRFAGMRRLFGFGTPRADYSAHVDEHNGEMFTEPEAAVTEPEAEEYVEVEPQPAQEPVAAPVFDTASSAGRASSAGEDDERPSAGIDSFELGVSSVGIEADLAAAEVQHASHAPPPVEEQEEVQEQVVEEAVAPAVLQEEQQEREPIAEPVDPQVEPEASAKQPEVEAPVEQAAVEAPLKQAEIIEEETAPEPVAKPARRAGRTASSKAAESVTTAAAKPAVKATRMRTTRGAAASKEPAPAVEEPTPAASEEPAPAPARRAGRAAKSATTSASATTTAAAPRPTRASRTTAASTAAPQEDVQPAKRNAVKRTRGGKPKEDEEPREVPSAEESTSQPIGECRVAPASHHELCMLKSTGGSTEETAAAQEVNVEEQQQEPEPVAAPKRGRKVASKPGEPDEEAPAPRARATRTRKATTTTTAADAVESEPLKPTRSTHQQSVDVAQDDDEPAPAAAKPTKATASRATKASATTTSRTAKADKENASRAPTAAATTTAKRTASRATKTVAAEEPAERPATRALRSRR